MDRWGWHGGIFWLLDLADAHPAELYADFRSQYGVSFAEVGHSVSYGEAVYLVKALLNNPTSLLNKAHNDWKYPVSYEWMLLAELLDLTIRVNSKNKTKPIERPWPKENSGRLGGKSKQRRVDVIRSLQRMNPKE